MIDALQFVGVVTAAGFCFRVGWGLAGIILRPRRPAPAQEPELPFSVLLMKHARWSNEMMDRELGIKQPPEKPQPSGGRMIRGDQPPPARDH